MRVLPAARHTQVSNIRPVSCLQHLMCSAVEQKVSAECTEFHVSLCKGEAVTFAVESLITTTAGEFQFCPLQGGSLSCSSD